LNFLKLKPSKVRTRSKKRHAHFQTPSDFRGVLNQIFAIEAKFSNDPVLLSHDSVLEIDFLCSHTQNRLQFLVLRMQIWRKERLHSHSLLGDFTVSGGSSTGALCTRFTLVWKESIYLNWTLDL
jgi:hypothetical protein